MKIGSIRLKSYIGIANGLGLDEIYIDFTKGTKKLILIHGDNGSGKSTLLNALSPFPDDNSSFIPGKQAEKEMTILNGDISYHINIIHGINSRGDRETTKAYITKNINGELIKLNPNGNVSSYKDILYTEFNLDPNYISLSKLSMDEKGLVDKTPSERKKFVNNVLESLDVYNNIHKSLVKRSSIFKSLINNLTSKIEYLGDEEKLSLTLNNIVERLDKLIDQKDDVVESIASNKTIISITDPDNSIQDSYKAIYNELLELDKKKKEHNDKIDTLRNRLNLSDITEEESYKLHKKVSDEVSDLVLEIQIDETNINNQLSERESNFKSLELKTEKLKALNNNMNYDDLKESIKESKKKIKAYEEVFKKLNIEKPENISIDEYLTVKQVLEEINYSIEVFKSNRSYEVIMDSVYAVRNNSVIDIGVINDGIDGLKECIDKDKEELKYYENLLNISSKISMRPDKCKINDCPFIKDAYEAYQQNPEEHIEKLSIEIEANERNLNDLYINKQHVEDVLEAMQQIKIILRSVETYKRIISKFPVKDILLNPQTLLDRLQDNNRLEELDILIQYADLANIFEDYKFEKERLVELQNSLKVFESKAEIIDVIQEEIKELNEKTTELTKLIESSSNKILENKKTLLEKNEFLVNLDTLIDLYSGLSEIDKNANLQKSEYSAIKTNMVKINDAITNINTLNIKLEGLATEINELMKERETINHSLNLLKEYKVELDQYRNSYNKIETIKEYSSPNTGIQLLFIEIYMNKILSLSNELLSLLFEGRFQLQPFVINEKEFRIPCQGNGILNDDITSMSASERCLISMIISFSLLFQASSKYNILRLDEIDSPLDSSNRLQFLNVIEKQIEILQIEQTFMISHNSELDYNNVDLIVLKSKDMNYDDPSLSVIYKY